MLFGLHPGGDPTVQLYQSYPGLSLGLGTLRGLTSFSDVRTNGFWSFDGRPSLGSYIPTTSASHWRHNSIFRRRALLIGDTPVYSTDERFSLATYQSIPTTNTSDWRHT
eukprot:5467960-Pyramimonas_sp.AAC.1